MRCIKKLKIFSLKRQGLNTATGQISIQHRGGGCKKRYRFVDFSRKVFNVPFLVKFFEYDASRTAFLAFIVYANGLFSYILASQKLVLGSYVENGSLFYPNMVGNFLPLCFYKSGSILHSVEVRPFTKAALIRSAGNYCFLIQSYFHGLSVIRFKKGSICLVPTNSRAVFGSVSNMSNKNKKLFKAGQARWQGCRPLVRGVAKNPVDHPHGGNTSGGTPSISFSHVLSKGFSTSRQHLRNTKAKSFVVKLTKSSI